MSRVRVLIVDDHDTVRKALARLLTAQDWDVCGEAADGRSAIASAQQLKPDVIVMDLFMPDISGIDAARAIRAASPEMLIVLMTAPDPEVVEAARREGIRATVSKWDGRLVGAVHALLRGEECHHPDTA